MKKIKNIVAYPTESFFALGVPADNPAAIKDLFRVKKREKNKPIALIASDLKQVKKYFFMSTAEETVTKRFWPGALTILLKPKKAISADALFGTTPVRPSDRTTPPYKRRGGIRIGVRVPGHAGARRLAARAAAPITATSANISGQPSTKSAKSVRRAFPDILIAPGKCGRANKPSTVVELNGQTITILRHGAIKIQ